MADHRFSVGDHVHVARTASSTHVEAFLNHIMRGDPDAVARIWEIARLLPADVTGTHYRVRNADGVERHVVETQLEPVRQPKRRSKRVAGG